MMNSGWMNDLLGPANLKIPGVSSYLWGSGFVGVSYRSWPEPFIRVAEIYTNPMAAFWF
jgi:hypothetical protein